tara:strand:- start:6859 stop:7860 length:1002 start_codon:yes stop_codon:yes gene_type:complete
MDNIDKIKESIEKVTNDDIFKIEKIGAGQNNSIFKIIGRKNTYALKKYSNTQMNNRKNREIFAINLFKELNIENVPKALHDFKGESLVLYTWIEGKTKTSFTHNTLKKFSDFHININSKITEAKLKEIPEASETCLSIDRIRSQIDKRISEYKEIYSQEPDLKSYLEKDLIPLYEKNIKSIDISLYKKDLDLKDQAAIVSDFGLHNALIDDSENVNFIDFEYFGRDDPVTCIANFILHPGMNLLKDEADFFIKNILYFHKRKDKSIVERYKDLLPFYSIRWALIILNEFIPEKWKHRKNSGAYLGQDYNIIKKNQLIKAKKLTRFTLPSFIKL